MAVGSVGKRKAERRDCYVKAQVQYADGRPSADCIILNFSATGARVQMPPDVELPPRFKLFIPSRPETKAVLLRWRRGNEFGCEYSTGLADENTFFALLDRVDMIEALVKESRGAAAPGEAQASAGDPAVLERIAEIEKKIAASGKPPKRDDAMARRLADLEERLALLADAPPLAPAADPGLARRVAEVEGRLARLAGAPASTQAADPNLARRVADVEERLATLAVAAAPTPATDSGLARRLAEVEGRVARLAETPAPSAEFEERLGQVEGELARQGLQVDLFASAPSAPDSSLVKRICEMEAKLMAKQPPALALDLSPLERQIEAVARDSETAVERAERFLNARIDEIEANMIAAPAPVQATRSFDTVGLEMRLIKLEQTLAAPAPAPGDVSDALERLSNLELALFDLRDAINEGGELDQRIAHIEERNGDVIAALRNVLALLTARSEPQRAAS